MCRILGCVAAEPVSIRRELVESENPLIRQSEQHDSGWGMAVYAHADGGSPRCIRFPEAAHLDGDFRRATELRGRIFNAHVRRATIGGLTEANTHPFCMGDYSFSHNGTVLRFPALLGSEVRPPRGDTDSEALFNFLMSGMDPGDVAGSLRRAVTATIERSAFSGLNFLFSEGERLYAYRLGVFELHWLSRGDRLMVASERLSDEPWHSVQQDVLLTVDPDDLEEPHAERLVGEDVLSRARIEAAEQGAELRGEERGRFAAERAARVADARA